MERKSRQSIELDDQLSDYLGVLWRRWPLVLGGTLLVGLMGLALALLVPSRYEAEAILMLEAPDNASADAALSTLNSLLQRQDVLSRASEATTGTASVDNLRNVAVGPGPRRNLASARLSLDEPARAATALNAMVTHALSLYESLESDSSQLAKASLRRRLDAATARMQALEEPVVELRQKIDGLRAPRQSGVKAPDTATQELYRLELALARHEAELKAARTRYVDLGIQLQDVIEQNTRVRLSVLTPAAPPSRPAPSQTGFTVMVAALAGFVLATVAAFVVDYFSADRFDVRPR
jgi:succinoglycan biosynthesis transport protein ExoP